MGLPQHTRSDMCESLLGLLPITAEIDIKKLQFFGRLCELNTTYLTKRIFIIRLFSYLFNPSTKHYGFIQDITLILLKYNLYHVLTEYLANGFFPNKSQWKISVKSSVISFHSSSRRNRMLADPDFVQFNILCADKPPKHLWVIPDNIQGIVLCKFIVKLWTLLNTPPESCCLCAKSFTNVFEHITTVCPETSLYRNAWWETVIEDYDISLGAELSGLSQNDLYLFLLGARGLTTSLSDYDSPGLHLFNFRFIKDVAAAYYRKTTASS